MQSIYLWISGTLIYESQNSENSFRWSTVGYRFISCMHIAQYLIYFQETEERVQGAQQAMSNAGSAKERLEGFISKTEDFHRLINFLEVQFLPWLKAIFSH